MSDAANTLHPIEKAILKTLSAIPQSDAEGLAASTALGIDQIRRGIEWLKFKELVSVEEKSARQVSAEVTSAKKLPERRLVDAIKQGMNTFRQIQESNVLSGDEFKAAIAGAKRNQWVQISNSILTITDQSNNNSNEEILLDELAKHGGSVEESLLTQAAVLGLDNLKSRPGYIAIREQKQISVSLSEKGRAIVPLLDNEVSTERRLSTELIISGKWKEVKFSAIDVEAPAPSLSAGRKHPIVDFIDEVKEIFVGLGFSEIEGTMTQSGFWNFDALFTPQDHPAREMQDTFYISGEKQQSFASSDQVKKVSAVHERDWGYKWDIEEAKRLVLRTHTTPVTLQHLAQYKPENERVFSVGRVFRNEKVSYKHLVEFFQVEGVFTGKDVSLRQLMGLQREFYNKLGIKKIKFWPTFFPYTEPSLQTMVYNDRLEKWIELFGMGIFRPEVTKPLGIPNPVLAWGGGLERIAMLRFGLDDVRELYTNRTSWLRSVPRCPL